MIVRLTPEDFAGLAQLGITLTIETEAEGVTWSWPEGSDGSGQP